MDDYGEVVGNDTVRFRRLLPGPIERVWEHLVDGDKRGKWLCSGKTEQRVGGKIDLIFRNNDLSDAPDVPRPEKHKDMPEVVSFEGIVTAYEPPHRFSHTWVFGDESSEVRYELEKQGDQVLLTLTQVRLESREMKVDVSGGWHAHLDVLESVLKNEAPGPFWKRVIELEAEYDKRIPK